LEPKAAPNQRAILSAFLAPRRKEHEGRFVIFDLFGQAQGKRREKSFLDPAYSLGMTAATVTS
jgi:hypothetical protein